jgi:predicted Zn-dependent peptidase
MRAHRPRLGLVALGVLLVSPAAHAQSVSFEIRERVLDNGVRVLVLDRPNHAGRVAARVFYQADIAAERPGTAGLTHMLEHHLFKGSPFLGTTDWEAERDVAERVERTAREMEDEKNRLSACFRQRDTADEMERLCRTARLDSLVTAYDAAVAEQDRYTINQPDRTAYMAAGATGLTASTGRDWMKYHADLPAHRLETFMWIERSRMDNPVFRQFDPEKQVVIEQIRRAFNRADAAFNRSMRSLTYEAHPYGWAHWFSDLEGATREDHWEIYYKHFAPQNTIIVVVGAIDADEVFRLAERYWGDWPPTRASPRLRTVEPVPAGERRLTARAAAGPALALNVAAPAVGHADQPALEVLAELLGGHAGMLMRRLGNGLGLVNGASASFWTSKYPSHFGIHLSVRSNDDLPAAERELMATLDAIARGQVSGSAVRDAVRAMTFRFVASFDEPGNAAVTIGSYAAIHDWRLVNELPGLWAAVTPADLARVVTRYFAPERRVIGVLERVAQSAQADTDGGQYDALVQARPGAWPAGGAVEELAQPLPQQMPAGSDTLFTRNLPPLVDAASGRWSAWGELRQPRAGEPLPVAENVWYVPPWMAVRRGILDDRPTTRPQRLGDIVVPEVPPYSPPREQEFRLRAPAGMPAFFVPDRFVPILQASLLIDAAHVDDPAGREGLGRLAMETLMASGTDRLSADELRARLDGIGASIRTSSNAQRTRIDVLAPSESAEEALALLGALITGRRYDDALVARLRARAATQAERSADDPAPVLDAIFARAIFGATHPLASAATRTSIESITTADVAAYLDRVLTGARLSLALSGAAAPPDVQRWVNESFRALDAGSAPGRAALPAPRPTGERLVAADRVAAQGHVKMGYPGFAAIPDDHAAFELMNYIFCGAGQGSRLFQRLRTELGLTAAVYCEADPRLDGATTYEIRFSGNPPTVAEAIWQTCEDLDAIVRDGVTREEFERARTAFLEGHIPWMYSTPHRVATRFAEMALLGRYDYTRSNYLNYYAGDAAQVEAVRRTTHEQVNAAVRRYLRPGEMVVAVVGPLQTLRAGTGPQSARGGCGISGI